MLTLKRHIHHLDKAVGCRSAVGCGQATVSPGVAESTQGTKLRLILDIFALNLPANENPMQVNSKAASGQGQLQW